jgi:hypothetical protein
VDIAEQRTDYFPERNKLTAFPIAICQCKKGDPCGEDCINRLMFYLCSPKTCPAGESCTNGPLSLREPLNVTHFWTGSRGFGLKTLVDIPAGSFIMEVCDAAESGGAHVDFVRSTAAKSSRAKSRTDGSRMNTKAHTTTISSITT